MIYRVLTCRFSVSLLPTQLSTVKFWPRNIRSHRLLLHLQKQMKHHRPLLHLSTRWFEKVSFSWGWYLLCDFKMDNTLIQLPMEMSSPNLQKWNRCSGILNMQVMVGLQKTSKEMHKIKIYIYTYINLCVYWHCYMYMIRIIIWLWIYIYTNYPIVLIIAM